MTVMAMNVVQCQAAGDPQTRLSPPVCCYLSSVATVAVSYAGILYVICSETGMIVGWCCMFDTRDVAEQS